MKLISLLITFLFTVLFFTSCKKGDAITEVAAPIDSVVSYKIIVTGTWKMPAHTVPAGDHFTKFVGMLHNDSSAIFRLGGMATLGVKNVAELGYNTTLKNEIDNYIGAAKALSIFYLTLPNITGTDSAIVTLTTKYSLISFESMIAPSPDWFVGLESYNLIQHGKWVSDLTIKAAGYDAGTEEGNVFGYNNPPTIPQQNISLLTPSNASVIANGNLVIAPFATVRFIKQ